MSSLHVLSALPMDWLVSALLSLGGVWHRPLLLVLGIDCLLKEEHSGCACGSCGRMDRDSQPQS